MLAWPDPPRTAGRWVPATLLAAAVGLAACVGAPSPSPADRFLEPIGENATGPVTELGAGTGADVAWRVGTYPTPGGPCLQLAVGDDLSARCDDLLPIGDAAIGSVGSRTAGAGGATVVDGLVSGEVATLWLVAGSVARLPAVLVPLGEDEDPRAFVGIMPAEVELTHLQAVAANGEVLETRELR